MNKKNIFEKGINKLYNTKIDWVLMFLVVAIMGLSLIPMYTLTFMFNELFIKKIIYSLIGVIIIICLVLFDYRKLEKLGLFLYLSSVMMMLWIGIFGMGSQKIWYIGNIRIDLMFSLLFIYLAWASILQHRDKYPMSILHLLFWIPILLYLWNGYYLYAVIYFITILILMNIDNIKNSQYKFRGFIGITLIIAIILSSVLFSFLSPYQKEGFQAFLYPEEYKDTLNYQRFISRETIINAEWLGQSYTSEQIKKLSEPHTYFILPYIIYVFGWSGGLLLALVFFFFTFRLIQIAIKAHHPHGKLIVIGGLTIFLISTFTNVLMSVTFLPFASISLPFVSHGGQQLIFYSIIVGLIMSVYRHERLK